MASRAQPTQLISNSHVYTDIHPYYNILHLFSAVDNIRECLVVIKRWDMDRHEDSYKISKDGAALYFLRGLDNIVHFNRRGKKTMFYVYESHTPINKWMEDPDNVIQNGSYTKNFLQILR